MSANEVSEEIDTPGDILEADIDQPAGNLLASVRKATSAQGSQAPDEPAKSERNNRQATSDDFDPRSTLHREPATTLEDGELADDLDDLDVEGNRIDPKKAPPQPGAELEPPAKPPVAPPADPFANILEAAKVEGFDLSAKYRTGAEAFKGLLHSHRLVGQRNESAQEWDTLVNSEARQREVYAELHKIFGTPAPIPAPVPAPAAVAPAPGAVSPAAASNRERPPTLPKGWQYHYENNQPKPNADPNVIAAVEAVRADRQLQQEDPAAWNEKWFAKDAEDRALKVLEAKLAERDKLRADEAEKLRKEQEQGQAVEQMKTSTIDRMHKEGWFEWLYEPGYQVRGSNVEGKLTEAGEVFNRFIREAAQAHDHGVPLYPTAYQRAAYARGRLQEHYTVNGTAPTSGHAAPQNDPRLHRAAGGDVVATARAGEYPAGWSLQQKLAHDLKVTGAAAS